MPEPLKQKIPAEIVNTIFVTFVVLVLASEALVFVAWILGHVPVASPLSAEIFPENLPMLRPEREIFLYRLFVVLAMALQAAAVWHVRADLRREGLVRKYRAFAIVESLILFFLLSALFKMQVYAHRPQLATMAFHVMLVIAALNKIFWWKLRALGSEVFRLCLSPENRPVLKQAANLLVPALLFLILYVPDHEAAVARMAVGEQFHHMEVFMMAPGWAYTAGDVPDIDVISRYGFGAPVLMSHVTRWLGGFTYEHVVLVFIWMCVVYYFLWYGLLRLWYRNLALVAVALLLGIKVQMFHDGVYPFVFTYPSATPARYWFDIFALWAIFFHLRTQRRWLLVAAGAVSGIAIFYNTAEGLYLTAAFYFYIFFQLITPHLRSRVFRSWKDIPWLGLYAALPLTVALVSFWLVVRSYLFKPVFWSNMTEFARFYLAGMGDTPMYQSLVQHMYLANLMGDLFPVVYGAAVIVVCGFIYFKKAAPRELFVPTLAIYGLGLYHYYVALSSPISYYPAGLPFVFIVVYGIGKLLDLMSERFRRNATMALVLFAVYALSTNQLYISYPNLLNFSRNPYVDPLVAQPLPNGKPYFNHKVERDEAKKMPLNDLGQRYEDLRAEGDFKSDRELKNYWRQIGNFKIDAQMIRQLTAPDEKVALLSSFEVKILMQAERRPFFYYFPMINTQPIRARTFMVVNFFSVDHYKRLINDLETAKPQYIFMERKFLQRQVPQNFYYDYAGLMELIDYTMVHYEPRYFGEFLVAMQRKPGL